MNHDIPLKYFDIADEYATECAEPVAEARVGSLAAAACHGLELPL